MMIRLTRVNNQLLAVNSDLIKFVEQTHDTVLTLINGDKIVVRESLEEVIRRTLEFRRSILVDPTAAHTAVTTLGIKIRDGRTSEVEDRRNARG